jgi:hypothetical protein
MLVKLTQGWNFTNLHWLRLVIRSEDLRRIVDIRNGRNLSSNNICYKKLELFDNTIYEMKRSNFLQHSICLIITRWF